MWTFTIFLILTLVEGFIIWMKYDQINEYREMGKEVAILTGADKSKQYTAFVRISSKIIGYAKPLLIFLGGVLLFVNFIAALILGGILSIFF